MPADPNRSRDPVPRAGSLLPRAFDGLDAFALAASLAVFGLADWWSRLNYRNVADDALISLRYAQQWVAGNGLVFNAGERVEGYTNFLWTAVLAIDVWIAQLLSLDPVAVASASSALVAAANPLLVYALARRLFAGDPLSIAVAVGYCVVDDAYTVWAMQALEGPFLCFWMLLSLQVWQGHARRRGIWLGLCLAATWLTRPDAALFVGSLLGVFGLDLVVRHLRGRALVPGELRDFRQASLLCALIYGGYFAWRVGYYGFLLPNTFYAKVGGGVDGWARGLDYTLRFFAERAWLPGLALLALTRWRSPLVRVLLLYCGTHTAYVIWAGGDFYPGHRFFVPLMPALGLLLGVAVDALRDRFPEPARWAVAVGLLLAIGTLGLERGPIQTGILRWRDKDQRNRAFMTWLREHSPADATIFGDDIGSIGVFADRRALDFHGIIDPHVAHQRVADLGSGKAGHEKTASLDYVLERRPEYIKFGLMFVNLYEHGYYLDTSMPLDFRVAGIWRLDTLSERGSFGGDELLTGETPDASGWVAEGEAFAEFPTRRAAHGSDHFVLGQRGAYASSYAIPGGSSATGRLLSPEIRLTGDRLVLRVAGGHDPERLRVCLRVGEQRPHCTTGFESIAFGRREWDISDLRGRLARLELVDESDARNGIIMLDEVRQWTADARARDRTARRVPREPVPPGRWRPVEPAAPETADPAWARRIARIQALGYADGSELPRDEELVRFRDRERAQPGLNFYVSGHEPAAFLTDMQGEILHRWQIRFREVWPERSVAPQFDFWRRAHVRPDGRLLAIWDGLGIIELDRDSNLLWASEIGAHHDLEVQPDGDIYVLTRVAHEIPRLAKGRILIEDFVTVLSPDGATRRSVSLLESLERSQYAQALRDLWYLRRPRDPLHTNSLQVLSGAFAERAPWLRRGNVLTSFRELNMLAVVDLDQRRIVKAWTGDFRAQHDPRLLADGRLLFFDNNLRETGSRVVEFDPVSGRETWSYHGATPADFFSEFCGTAQRLPNGNTLVTESSRGRAFEVTREGGIVWELHSPHRAGSQRQFVASLLELRRLPPDFGATWRGVRDRTAGGDPVP